MRLHLYVLNIGPDYDEEESEAQALIARDAESEAAYDLGIGRFETVLVLSRPFSVDKYTSLRQMYFSKKEAKKVKKALKGTYDGIRIQIHSIGIDAEITGKVHYLT